MKSISLFFICSILFSASLRASERDCHCNSLAGNFPGYSLYCGDQLIERFLFVDYFRAGVELTHQICRYRAMQFEETPLEGQYSDCLCQDDHGSTVLMKGENNSAPVTIHEFQYGPRGHDDAIAGCTRTLSQMLRVGMCSKAL